MATKKTTKKTTTKTTTKSTSRPSGVPAQAAQYIKQAEEKTDDKKKREAARKTAARFAPQAAMTKTEKRTYVVKSGDSLSKIAGKLLGDVKRWPEIYEANKDKIKNPDLIYPGQEFVIPEK
jgi:Ca2+-transporting ATPase